jgi:DNA-directed RNA polymerase specialized sigma24 family protein
MRKTRTLTAAQKERAESALTLVPAAVRAFVSRHPCYGRLVRHCDLYGAAELAVVEASFTYDPARSKPTTYYGSAIRHALLKEVKRVQRSREAANERVDLGKALGLSFTIDQRQQALACLRLLPPEERDLIEAHVLEGKSLNSIGRDRGRDWRTIKSRLLDAFVLLRSCVEGYSDTPSGSQGDEPQEQGPHTDETSCRTSARGSDAATGTAGS